MFIRPNIKGRPAARRYISILSCRPFSTCVRKTCIGALAEPDSERFGATRQILGAGKLVHIGRMEIAVRVLLDLHDIDLLEQRAVGRIEPDLSTRRGKDQAPHRGYERSPVTRHLAP